MKLKITYRMHYLDILDFHQLIKNYDNQSV